MTREQIISFIVEFRPSTCPEVYLGATLKNKWYKKEMMKWSNIKLHDLLRELKK